MKYLVRRVVRRFERRIILVSNRPSGCHAIRHDVLRAQGIQRDDVAVDVDGLERVAVTPQHVARDHHLPELARTHFTVRRIVQHRIERLIGGRCTEAGGRLAVQYKRQRRDGVGDQPDARPGRGDRERRLRGEDLAGISACGVDRRPRHAAGRDRIEAAGNGAAAIVKHRIEEFSSFGAQRRASEGCAHARTGLAKKEAASESFKSASADKPNAIKSATMPSILSALRFLSGIRLLFSP